MFGEPLKGTEADPAVYMESVHFLLKMVAGAPNIRPAWFFDNTQQGEGLNDVGTHLVDLVQWTLFPDQALDYRQDTKVLSAQRWATPIPEAEFRRVTGEPRLPDVPRASRSRTARCEYFCNTLVSYTLARRSHQAERDLGLGAGAGRGRHPLRVLQGIAREGRSAADAGRQAAAGALRRAGERGRCAARC